MHLLAIFILVFTIMCLYFSAKRKNTQVSHISDEEFVNRLERLNKIQRDPVIEEAIRVMRAKG